MKLNFLSSWKILFNEFLLEFGYLGKIEEGLIKHKLFGPAHVFRIFISRL